MIVTRLFLGFCCLSLLLPVYAADPDADDGEVVGSSIREVTVYADRAQVLRVASVDLTGDVNRFAFAKLPGWIDEGSVRVAVTPGEAAQIADVQIRRTFLARPSDEEFRKADQTVQEISDQIAALDDEKAILEQQGKHLEAMRMFSLEKLPKDVAVREIKPAEYGETVEFIAGAERKIASAKRELERKRRDLQPELSARQRKLEELRQRTQLEQRSVIVLCKGARAGKATLRLTYMLPGATWEPVHELRASTGAKGVSLASYAVVMQTTGEDWTGVQLALSTQKSTETLKIPELDAFLVGTGRRMVRVASSSAESFALARQNYAGQSGLFNTIMNGDVLVQEEYRKNQKLQLDCEQRISQLFENLQQRGTTAHFAGSGAQTVRADGRSVRIPIGAVELDAVQKIVAAPEVSLNAVRTVDLANTSKKPLIPGKVAIYLEGAFLGLTETDFVAPGESFSLYLGVVDQIKLSRTLDKKRSELKSGGAKTRMQLSFVSTVENLSDLAQSIQMAERIPVSETEEVKISNVRIQPVGKPDVKGVLRWDLNLAPRQTREFRIEYTLEYPTQLPARKTTALPATEGRSAGIDLHEQIKSLELELRK